MNFLILLLLILTVGAWLDAGAPAMRRAWQRIRGGAKSTLYKRMRNAAAGLLALAFVAAQVAHDAQAPLTELMAGRQDEIAAAMTEGSPQWSPEARADEQAAINTPARNQ
jgi:hypothetical protein